MKLTILIISLSIFRILFGVCSEFWFEDELQIYLIGLKHFTTNSWPYFGPDLVYTNTQIPGALQGLLISIPLKIIPIPESPTIFLNVLSIFSLIYLSKYISFKFPELPKWLIYGTVLLTPWAMVYSTQVVNPSYVLPFAVLFFISFIDLSKIFESKFQNEKLSFLLLGFSTGCIMQLHLSWVIFFPYILYILYINFNIKYVYLLNGLLIFFGFLIAFTLLIPTYIKYGIFETGGTEKNIVLNYENLKSFFVLYSRLFSFGAYEIPYILGGNNDIRFNIIKDQPYMILPTISLLVLGWIQVAVFTYFLIIEKTNSNWKKYKILLLVSFFVLYLSFLFSIKNPSSHTFYLLFPLMIIFTFYCYSRFYYLKPIFKTIFMVIISFSIVFYIGLSINSFKTRSLYVNRQKVQEAINKKDYKILGLRRADNWGYGY